MPNLAYLLKKFPRLSETFVLNEILAQERLGRDLHIFSRRPADDEPRHPELSRLQATVEELPSGAQLNPWALVLATAPREQRLLERLAATFEELRPFGHPRLASLMEEALFLVSRCRRLGIRHLHTHFATDSTVVALLAKRLGHVTYSVTAHAKDIYRSSVAPALLALLFREAERVVTVCDANVRHLEQILPEEALHPLRRLYNGIDLSAFTFAGEDGRGSAHVLSIGRLVEKKGFAVLLDALRRLAERGLPFRATLVGDGEDRRSLEARAAELDLGSRVTFTGALPQDEVRDLLRRATLFCLPCQIGEDGNRDALPTVLLEALASGLPVVSTPVTGIPEILDHGAAGLLVPEGDVEATADAMAQLLAEPGLRRQLASAGRQRAETHFDLDQSSRTLGRWFDEILERKLACASPA